VVFPTRRVTFSLCRTSNGVMSTDFEELCE
jgi:hypothetical protein